MIPLYIIEEHHEAFFIWNYAIMKNIIADRKHTLLHVDEHDDMSVPTLHKSVMEAKTDKKSLLDFTTKQSPNSSIRLKVLYVTKLYWRCVTLPSTVYSSQSLC